MCTVALVGADGAGKSTIGRRLAATLPLPIKYLYMGDNADSANRLLPTTRLIRLLRRVASRRRGDRQHVGSSAGAPPGVRPAAPRPRGIRAHLTAATKATYHLVNQLAEEWFRQTLAWYYQVRGYIVLFDRHFFVDYYAHHIAPRAGPRSVTSRIHGFVLKYAYPKPDVVICLDAPAALLFARKPEGTVEAIERRRREYFQVQPVVKHFAVVDASQSEDDVTRAVVALITEFCGSAALHQETRETHVA